MDKSRDDSGTPARVARLRDEDDRCVLQAVLFLEDRPGQLAELASTVAECRGNITAFDYDRSDDLHRVLLEACFPGPADFDSALGRLKRWLGPAEWTGDEDVQVTDAASVLDLRIALIHRPGELANLARVFLQHQANVVRMHYHHLAAPEEAHIAVAAPSREEVSALLSDLNRKGYRYEVLYRGDESQAIGQVIGLKLTERLYLRFRELLGAKDADSLRGLVHSSSDVSRRLEEFAREAGKQTRAGEVFTQLLALAASSRRQTGPDFHFKALLDEERAGVRLLGLMLPTGANVYVLQRGSEAALIDCGYGLYFRDLAGALVSLSVPPESVGRVLITHPDADHAGTASCFEEEYGAAVVAHPFAASVFHAEDRGLGSDARHARLLRLYTQLIDAFTESRAPVRITPLAAERRGEIGGFPVMCTLDVCGLEITVLESLGGHVPAQVFHLCREARFITTGDYLINTANMSQGQKDLLSIPRFLMTSTNADSALFRREMEQLTALAHQVDAEFRAEDSGALTILPGHGEPYAASTLEPSE